MADNSSIQEKKGGQVVKPLVSVVIPAYNCEGVLPKAIESVCKQEIPLELIVIDDASQDMTKSVILECKNCFQKHYIQWKLVFHETNQGVAATRNEGVSLATAPYVAFLDSDDWWADGKLNKQLSLLDETGCVLCSTAREFVTSKGITTEHKVYVPERITYDMLLHENVINCSSVVAKTDVLREFPMGHDNCHEDYITWLQILKKYGDVCAINEPLLMYRRSNSSKSSNKLKSAWMHYNSLRVVGIHPIKAFWYFCFYVVRGFAKHFLAG